MVFTGRLVKDAAINTLKDERSVVNFTVALNDYYKPKGYAEGKQYTTFVECAYWMNTNIGERLKKGRVVEIIGRPYVTAYIDMQGNAKAILHCHVQTVKLHLSNGSDAERKAKKSEKKREEAVTEDLPF